MTELHTSVSIGDRAFNYGDGCFTTIAVINSLAVNLDKHLARMRLDCHKLNIQFSDWQDLKLQIESFANTIVDEKAVIKVVMSRGIGGRGYSAIGASSPNFVISVHQYPSHYLSWQTDGITLGLADLQLGKQPVLAGAKHLNRLEQVLIKQQLDQSEFDDLLVMDSDNHIVETSASNIFWYSNEQGWCTPHIHVAGVAGVTREAIIEYMSKNGIGLLIEDFPINAILEAKQVFICNSLMQIVPVTKMTIHGNEYSLSIDMAKRMLRSIFN